MTPDATSPRLCLIAARARNGIIGNKGGMPWRMRDDLAFFKQVTMGRPMIMGRKTFESLPGLLPGRPHLVVTRNAGFEAKGAEIFPSLDHAIAYARSLSPEDIFVIGGGELYRLALPIADRLYITEIDAEPEGDTSFPAFDEGLFRLIDELPIRRDHANQYDAMIRIFDRRSSAD